MSRLRGSTDCHHEECRRNARIETEHHLCCGGHECEEDS